MITATAVDAVCMAGMRVAVHFATASGVVVVLCPLASFLAKVRAERDHNGSYFPMPPTEAGRDGLSAQLVADAEAAPPPAPVAACKPMLEVRGRAGWGEAAERCPDLWADFAAGKYDSICAAAKAYGIAPSSVSNWIAKHHPGEVSRINAQHRQANEAPKRAAQAAMEADDALTIPEAAAAQGISADALTQWIYRYQRPWLDARKRRRRTRRRVAQGKPVSDEARAAAGLPLPKPAGKTQR